MLEYIGDYLVNVVVRDGYRNARIMLSGKYIEGFKKGMYMEPELYYEINDVVCNLGDIFGTDKKGNLYSLKDTEDGILKIKITVIGDNGLEKYFKDVEEPELQELDKAESELCRVKTKDILNGELNVA